MEITWAGQSINRYDKSYRTNGNAVAVSSADTFSIWKNKIIPFFKKLKDYRGITLMSHLTNVFVRIILNRIGVKVEREQSEK